MIDILLLALAALATVSVLAWLVSLLTHDVSFVDSLWSLFFLLAAIIYLPAAGVLNASNVAVFVLVAIWALRLSIHITVRNRGESEDQRYQEIRRKNSPNFSIKSLYIVFLLQGVLAWIVSMPLLFALRQPEDFGVLSAAAIALWSIGFVFEAGGDWQLQRFKAKKGSAGRVLDVGLWRYTRHPNYFGDACIWWSYWLFAAANGGWWTIFSPLLMTFLLLRVSGVAMLERTIGERRPAYREYIERTSAFFPRPPKPRSGGGVGQ